MFEQEKDDPMTTVMACVYGLLLRLFISDAGFLFIPQPYYVLLVIQAKRERERERGVNLGSNDNFFNLKLYSVIL